LDPYYTPPFWGKKECSDCVIIETNPVILKKVGLMNQTPTRNQNPIQDNQLIQIRQGGFDESNPYKFSITF
jgi:hypothetical protein